MHERPFFRSRVYVETNSSAQTDHLTFYGPIVKDESQERQLSEKKMSECSNETAILNALEGTVKITSEVLRRALTCRWKIRAPPGSVIRITFRRLNLAKGKPSDHFPLEVSCMHLCSLLIPFIKNTILILFSERSCHCRLKLGLCKIECLNSTFF